MRAVASLHPAWLRRAGLGCVESAWAVSSHPCFFLIFNVSSVFHKEGWSYLSKCCTATRVAFVYMDRFAPMACVGLYSYALAYVPVSFGTYCRYPYHRYSQYGRGRGDDMCPHAVWLWFAPGHRRARVGLYALLYEPCFCSVGSTFCAVHSVGVWHARSTCFAVVCSACARGARATCRRARALASSRRDV